MAISDFDEPPIRPGAAPTLDTTAVGFAAVAASQPIWMRMTEVLVRWLRYHFSAASRIEYPFLVNRVWVDNETSPIMIDSLARWNPNQSQERPAILVDRLNQETDVQHRVLGEQYQGIRPGNYTGYMVGHHVVHCLGGRDGETEYLASEVWREIKRFGHIARQYLCLARFLPEQILKRKQLSDEHREHYATSIVLSYNYTESFRTYNVAEAEITQIQTVIAGL